MELVREPRVGEVSVEAQRAWSEYKTTLGTVVAGVCSVCGKNESPHTCACARRVFYEQFMATHWPIDTKFIDALVDETIADLNVAAHFDDMRRANLYARARAFARTALANATPTIVE